MNPPETLALAHDVVSQVSIHVGCALIALLGHQVSQLLLVIVCKVALPLTIVKPLHLYHHKALMATFSSSWMGVSMALWQLFLQGYQ